MLAFLIFSDWFNPGDKHVEMADGTRFEATLQYETEGAYDLRLKQAALGHGPAEVVRLAKAEVATIEDVDTWDYADSPRPLVPGRGDGRADRVDERGLARLARLHGVDGQHLVVLSKLLVPLLFAGVFIVGFLGALIPEQQVAALVGDDSLMSNLIASVVGCLFYFATLTEVPILQALMRNGMASGPALALLLAGPALSLPSIPGDPIGRRQHQDGPCS